MNKKFFIALLASFSLLTAPAQTLFTYGKYAVDAKEFLRAYNKNNTTPVVNKAKAISDYLDLYINSKLKIREAYDKRYDTLAQIKTEVENLRTQISGNYMNDPEFIVRLQKEAFKRSQKDVRVGHILISSLNTAGVYDTTGARLKKEEVLRRLEMGEDFLLVAQQLSDDPEAKKTKGDLGFITVFTLPYEFENVIYTTPIGKYSPIVLSRLGYHIFKNIEERKAVGKIKAQQILLAVPPGSTDMDKKKLATLADSLYKRIMAGDNFNRLASAFSNDYITAVNGGTMPDISVGRYDAAFEKVLWALPKDGAVSKPFLTSHGWHIVKRNSVKSIVTDENDKNNRQDLQTRIMADSRWNSSKDFIYNKVIEKAGLKKYPYDDAGMRAMTDSVVDLKPMTDLGRTIIASTPMFTIGDSTYTATTWVSYANTYRYKQDGTGAKPYEQVKDEFLSFSLYNYYRDHLEDFNEEFRSQMNEFKDGNIFFEIMQQEIWNKAQTDTAALLRIYEQNKKNYTWTQSADAVLFFCADVNSAKKVYDEVKKKPANWQKIVEGYAEKVVADSSRYEWAQLPNLLKMIPKPGMMTTPLVNTNDNTASFAYIVRVFSQPMQRTFNEARGMLITDYQAFLEKQWTETLKKKYPVGIDQKVLNEISK
ncbi:MAG: peptidylprolyl isomerase [Bacteroidota bacterium]|nr:peptidylprolyl isomerase [Bacteroidota bacterium]